MVENPVFVYVEDDPLSREVLYLLLKEGMGFPHVNVFEDGSQFLNDLPHLSPPPNVFLFDIHMAPYDGFALLELVRQQPQFATALIIALTASVMNEEVARLKNSGFNGVIPKPIDPKRFPMLLEKVLTGESVWLVK